MFSIGRLLWLVGSIAWVAFYINLSRPVLQRSVASIQTPIQTPLQTPIQTSSVKSAVNELRPQYIFFEGKKYVLIDNEFHEYKPDHRYKVRGVPTFYLNNGQVVKEAGQVADETGQSLAVQEVNKLLQMNPAQMYTREGVEQLLQSLEASRKSLADRDKALQEISR